jgi:LysR family transcriptional regulator, low CO2-responsive transcriptional regulator
MNFTLHQLRIFLEVVASKNISRAADKLHMTQPAVSIQLKNLQDQFDIPLTEIIGKRLYVTEFGFELAKMAEDILAGISTIEHKTMLYKGLLAGKLKIAAVSTGKYILPYYLSDFLSQHAHVELLLDVSQRENAVQSLEDNTVDFALVSIVPENLEVEEEVLIPNKLFMVASPEFVLPEDVITDSRLLDHIPIIFREKGSGTRLLLQQYLDRSHTQPKVKLELTSTEAVKQAVVAGLGVSVLSIFSMHYELKEKVIQIIPFKGFPLKSTWRLIWLKKKKLSPVAQAYLDFIRKEKNDITRRRFSWVDEY